MLSYIYNKILYKGAEHYMEIVDQVTNRFYVEEYNRKTGKTIKKVIKADSLAFVKIINRSLEDDYEIVKQGYVAQDTPLGIVGSSKVFRVPRGKRSESSQHIINYHIVDGVPRFQDFKDIEVDGYVISKKENEDYDLLKIIVPDGEISIVDITASRHLRYLIRGIQEFNEEMVKESEKVSDEDEDTNTDEDEDVVEEATEKENEKDNVNQNTEKNQKSDNLNNNKSFDLHNSKKQGNHQFNQSHK